jgi:2-polyprenyl-3-methyl-5-hydroxy-6-metoxy-1,4-benzoquinol methylase
MRRDHWRSEAAYFDRVAAARRAAIARTDARVLARYGAAAPRRRFAREFRFALHGALAGKTVVDVGCGDGRDTVTLALLGAERVIGVDLSPGAIELGRTRAELNGVADRVDFVCAPVETAPLAPGTFDVVWCNAILHHVTDNLDVVMRNMARWCKPTGLMSFAEPTNFNPTLRRLRKFVPVASGGATPDERPLEPRDFAVIRRYVPDLRVRHFGLLGRIDQFVLTEFSYERSSAPRRALVNATAAADWLLLSLPGFDRLGSTSVMWGRPSRP